MRARMETVVIGIGNPVLSDDSVGLQVVRCVARRLQGVHGVQTRELYSGGMRLMEAMAGFHRAAIIDAILTDGGKPGAVYSPAPNDLFPTRNAHSTHDGSLATAMELGRMAGLRLPGEIRVWAIEARDVSRFSERLTTDVGRAVPVVVESVMRFLGADFQASSGAMK